MFPVVTTTIYELRRLTAMRLCRPRFRFIRKEKQESTLMDRVPPFVIGIKH